MTTPRRIAIAAAATLALLLLVIVLTPLLFRDRIEARVKAEAGESVNANVEWSGIGLSLLRGFPNLSFRLDDLAVTGRDVFDGDTLVAVRRIAMVLDLGSVVGSLRRGDPIVVRSVTLVQPRVALRVLPDGTANWDITRDDQEQVTAEPARTVAFSLRRLEIRDGHVTMDDRQTGLIASASGLTQRLRGDFAAERFVLETRATAESVSVRFAGIPYLRSVRVDVNANVDADMVNRRFTLAQNILRVNALQLGVSGMFGFEDEDVVIDLAFETPRTGFGDILSLVPAVYARDFETIQTSGTMSVSGHVRGRHGRNAFPALALRAKVENGTFRYPDLPLPARDIFLDLAIDNPGGSVDSTVVNLSRFHVVIGGEPVDAALVIRTPVSDPDVDFRAKGKLDLADVGRTIRLEGVQELSGIVAADVAMRTRLSWLDAGQYDRVLAQGNLSASRLIARSSELPHDMRIEEAVLRLTPRHAELSTFRGTIGRSDIAATGSIDNVLGFALRDEELRGRATVRSGYFDLNEWRSDDEELEIILLPANIDFTLQASAGRVTFGALEMTDARGGLRLRDRRATLDDFRLRMLGGEVAVSGFYETVDHRRPGFDVALGMTDLDIPQAFTSLATVRMLAPVARYARGRFSADLRLRGALDSDMAPVYQALDGRGEIRAAGVVLQDFPAMHQLSEALKVPQLRNPAIEALRAAIEIRDGRTHVSPFDVNVGTLRMNVAGSNGIDQSLEYNIALALPRTALGAEANRVLEGLVTQAGRTGLELQSAEQVTVGVQLTGTIASPSIRTSLAGMVESTGAEVQTAVREELDRRLDAVEERVDAAAEEARRRAQEEALKLVAEAEERAATIREEARKLAATIRAEGDEQADALLARATTPVARMAAQPAADRLRREASDRADRVVREGDVRADALVAEARRRTESVERP